MKEFYRDILSFKIIEELENYVEFSNDGVRLAICNTSVMEDISLEYKDEVRGQSFELAFRCSSEDEVSRLYEKLIKSGAKGVKEPTNMPWGQRTAFFKDPDGNIHEIFAEII